MRWFKELRKPKLKCERLGHNMVELKRKIRTDRSMRYAAVDYIQTYKICSRCRANFECISMDVANEWDSCSMPSHMWDKIKENGFVVIR